MEQQRTHPRVILLIYRVNRGTVDKVRGAAVVVSERFLKGVPAGEPGGDELPERAVGGERVVPKLLHRDRAGPVAQHQPPGDMQLTAP